MIWCLHGFLGRGADWDAFRPLLRNLTGSEPRTPDLFDIPAELTPDEWGKAFADRVAAEDPAPSIIGYSMGGRLALHAMLARPALFRCAVLISTGLGFEDAERQDKRKSADEVWATRFENDPWSDVIAAWNAQDVFAGSPPMAERIESQFNRAALASALRLWSPAAHGSLVEQLSVIETNVLMVAGGRDAKYVREAERAAAALPNSDVWIVGPAGHRVPWERPESFKEALQAFFQQCAERRGA